MLSRKNKNSSRFYQLTRSFAAKLNNVSESLDNSTLFHVWSKLSASTKNSSVWRLFKSLKLSNWIENSRVISPRSRRKISSSTVYGWTVKEPDPDLVVIDLRETFSISPILTAFDDVIEFMVPAWMRSKIHTVYTAASKELKENTVKTVSATLFLAFTASLFVIEVSLELTLLSLGVLFLASVVSAYGTKSEKNWRDIKETKVFKLVIELLEPPSDQEGYVTPELDREGYDTAKLEKEGYDTAENGESSEEDTY